MRAVPESEAVADRRKGEDGKKDGERQRRTAFPKGERQRKDGYPRDGTHRENRGGDLAPDVAPADGEPSERPEPAREVLYREPRRGDDQLSARRLDPSTASGSFRTRQMAKNNV